MYVPTKRATLLCPSGPDHDPSRNHLFVVINDPLGLPPPGQVIIVPVCSVPPSGSPDPTCILDVGDHPFIRHPSYVAYSRARQVEATSLSRFVETGYFVDKGLLEESVFSRVAEGIGKSRQVKRFVADFLAGR